MSEAQRAENRKKLTEMLGALGTQQFELACSYLSDTVLCDWPYLPMPNLAESITGRDAMCEFFKGGMSAFEPYRYEITAVYDLVDPDQLIAEYHSNSRFLPTGAPYANRYLGIFRFEEGLIAYWREYINPQIVADVLASGGTE